MQAQPQNPDVTAPLAAAVLTVKQWLSQKSETFSAICGETFTHGEVLLTHLGFVAVVILLLVAEWLEGGTI